MLKENADNANLLKFDGTDPQVQKLLDHPFVGDGVEDGAVIRIQTAKSNRYVFVSDTSKALLGVDPESQLGRSAFDFISPDATPWVRRLLSAAAEGPLVSWYQTGDGVWVRTESMPIGPFIVGRLRVEEDAKEWKTDFRTVEGWT